MTPEQIMIYNIAEFPSTICCFSDMPFLQDCLNAYKKCFKNMLIVLVKKF